MAFRQCSTNFTWIFPCSRAQLTSCNNCVRFFVSGRDASLQAKKEAIRQKKAYVLDMDGVIYHENSILPGVKDFLGWIQKEKKQYLFLTNASENTPKKISQKLQRLTGFQIPEPFIYTSSLATATFLDRQKPAGTAVVVGSTGLVEALQEVGYKVYAHPDLQLENVHSSTLPSSHSHIASASPSLSSPHSSSSHGLQSVDFVVVGETRHLTLNVIEHAVYYVRKGAKLVGTNKDIYDRVGDDVAPSTGTVAAPIEAMSDTKAYFVGKPSALMTLQALERLRVAPSETAFFGDRMDTDILAGVEVGMDTVLLMTGVCKREEVKKYAWQPTIVLDNIPQLFQAFE